VVWCRWWYLWAINKLQKMGQFRMSTLPPDTKAISPLKMRRGSASLTPPSVAGGSVTADMFKPSLPILNVPLD